MFLELNASVLQQLCDKTSDMISVDNEVRKLFGFGVAFVLLPSKVYGLIWLIMRDAL
jgi:hypothetical protein